MTDTPEAIGQDEQGLFLRDGYDLPDGWQIKGMASGQWINECAPGMFRRRGIRIPARKMEDEPLNEQDAELVRVFDIIAEGIREFDRQVARHKAGGQMFSTAPMVRAMDTVRSLTDAAEAAVDVVMIWHTGDDGEMDDDAMTHAIEKLERMLNARR